jgi:subtilisin family serine protease
MVTGDEPVKILPVKMMCPDGGYDSDIADGIEYAADNGANVINLSLSGYGGYTPGQSYYLNISDNIGSVSGLNQKDAVKMQFSVVG